MLEDVKLAMRITNNEFDTEILGLMKAAQEDLRTSGVADMYANKPLVKQAVILYCKAMFGYDNNDSDKFMQAYEHIKRKIAITYYDVESE